MIFIVIPVFNRLNFTIGCLSSLARQTAVAHTIIVVDDGSSDGTSDYLRIHFPEVLVIKGDGNMWWTGATNAGVQKALALSSSSDDYILTLNNDLIVKEDYLTSLLLTANRYPRSLIGSVSLNIHDPEKVHFAGTRWNSRTARYRSVMNRNISYTELKGQTDHVTTDLLPGRGVLIPIEVFRKIGVYDDASFPHYMADEDFSLRAKKAGYGLLIATNAAVYNHVNETGLKKQPRSLQYYKDVFTSLKSPVNTRYRWNWAKRHATIFPPVYFTVDTLRILKSLLFKF